eukprot:scaffold287451_cov30-Tisochrysis_lutea.AAC.3
MGRGNRSRRMRAPVGMAPHLRGVSHDDASRSANHLDCQIRADERQGSCLSKATRQWLSDACPRAWPREISRSPLGRQAAPLSRVQVPGASLEESPSRTWSASSLRCSMARTVEPCAVPAPEWGSSMSSSSSVCVASCMCTKLSGLAPFGPRKNCGRVSLIGPHAHETSGEAGRGGPA